MFGIPRRVGGHTLAGRRPDRRPPRRASERMPVVRRARTRMTDSSMLGTLWPCASPTSATPASSSRSPTLGSSSTRGPSRPASTRSATSTRSSSPISTPTTSTRTGCRHCWRSTDRRRSTPTPNRPSCSTETAATSSSSPRARNTASGRRRSARSGGCTPSTTTAVPRCTNVGVVLQADGEPSLYHPGDAYDGEPGEVDVLAVPLNAPWSKVAETIGFVRRVAPRQIIPIHDALLSEVGTPAVPRARRGIRRRRPHRPRSCGRPRRRHHPRLSRGSLPATSPAAG